jgi:hypothetical protein
MVSVPHLKADFALRLNQPTAVFCLVPAASSAVSSPVPPLFSRNRKITNKLLISKEKSSLRIGHNSGGKNFSVQQRITAEGARLPGARAALLTVHLVRRGTKSGAGRSLDIVFETIPGHQERLP